MLDDEHLADIGGGELLRRSSDVGARDDHDDAARPPARCCAAAIVSHVTRFKRPSRCSATTRITGRAPRRAVGARARRPLSAGEPADHLRLLAPDRQRMRDDLLRRCSPGGGLTFLISFFLAAMMPLSVAYRSWLMPLWMVSRAGSGIAIHWNQPPSSSRLTRMPASAPAARWPAPRLP